MVYDVVVIGAGIAGLAAARVCAEAGLKVLVLEASARVGGRIRTLRAGDEVVELGAEFVHGKPPELLALIAEAGLTAYERTGAFLVGMDGAFAELDEDRGGVLEQLKSYAGEDCSFAQYVERLGLSDEEREAEIGYVEGFNAADAAEASILALGRQQAAEDAIDGGSNWRIIEGYDRVPEYVAERVRAAGGEIVFGVKVEVVDYRGQMIRVETYDTCYQARRVVVGVPLGVCQGAGLELKPVARTFDQATLRMRMGNVCRFTMIFKRRLWPEEMSFLLTPEQLPAVWWTARPAKSLTLTGWVGGPRCEELLRLSEEELRRRAVAAAAAAFGVEGKLVEQELVGFYTVNWTEEDGARGAYSWVAVGGVNASAEMAEPREDRLYFAGEHTDVTGHWGTVHGALRSGLRAGKQVLAALSSDPGFCA